MVYLVRENQDHHKCTAQSHSRILNTITYFLNLTIYVFKVSNDNEQHKISQAKCRIWSRERLKLWSLVWVLRFFTPPPTPSASSPNIHFFPFKSGKYSFSVHMTPARQTTVFRKTKIRMGKFVSRNKNQQIKGVTSSQTVLKCMHMWSEGKRSAKNHHAS